MIVKYNINCNKGVQKEVNIWNLLQWSIGTSMDLINFKTGQWLELVMRAKFYAYGAKLKRILTDRVSFFQILFIPPPLKCTDIYLKTKIFIFVNRELCWNTKWFNSVNPISKCFWQFCTMLMPISSTRPTIYS